MWIISGCVNCGNNIYEQSTMECIMIQYMQMRFIYMAYYAAAMIFYYIRWHYASYKMLFFLSRNVCRAIEKMLAKSKLSKIICNGNFMRIWSFHFVQSAIGCCAKPAKHKLNTKWQQFGFVLVLVASFATHICCVLGKRKRIKALRYYVMSKIEQLVW